MNSTSVDVVIGAGSGIGRALIDRWHEAAARPVLAVARSRDALACFEALEAVQTIACDYSDVALEALADTLREEKKDVARLVICNGVLQGEGFRPERALNQIEGSAMRQVFEVNAFLPMRVLAALSPVLKRSTAPRIAVLSARVGSIGDNRLGGWYSYRGSKAALNMMTRTSAAHFAKLNIFMTAVDTGA